MSNKPTFLLVRHGQSITNVNRELHKRICDPAVFLTRKGHNQAKMAGEAIMKFISDDRNAVSKIRIMRSTYTRAIQTSEEILGKLKNSTIPIDVKDLDRLRELEFGYVGALRDKLDHVEWLQNILRYQGFKFFATRYGGESPASMEPRVRLAIDAMYRDFAENKIDCFIVVCHGLTMRVLIKCLMNYDNEWYEKEMNPDNCSIRLIRNGVDEKFIYPNSVGQHDLSYTESEDKTKLNPNGLFFSQEQIKELIELQEKDPSIIERIGNMIECSRDSISANNIMNTLKNKPYDELLNPPSFRSSAYEPYPFRGDRRFR